MSRRQSAIGAYLRQSWTAVVAGVALVLAACGGGGVDAPPVSPTLGLTPPSLSVASGSTATLTPRATDRQGKVVGSPALVWQSSNTAIATVTPNGVVTGVLAGIANVTATYDGVQATVPVNVTPGAPATLAIRTQPNGASAGVALTVPPVVEVRDAAGNVVTNATSAVTATIGSGGGTISGTTTVNAVGGVATFSSLIIDGTIGDRTLTFSAPGLTPVTSAAFALQAGAPTQLVIRTQPNGAVVGVPFTTQPVIELRDAAGNLSTGSTLPVTATINSGGGTLSGAITANAVGGVATFSTLTLSGTVGVRTLNFSAAGIPAVTSAQFTLTAGAPATLAFRTPPNGGGLNSPFTPAPVIEVRDASGNVSTSATTVVTATLVSGGGTLSGNSATAQNGIATFTTLTVNGAAGVRTLSFGAPGLTAITASVRPCDASRPPQLDVGTTSRALTATAGGTIVLDSLRITDAAGSCTAIAGVQATVSAITGGNWLAAAIVGGQTILELRVNPVALAVGTYTATVTLSSSNAASVAIAVTLTVQPSFPVTYGDSTQKLMQLDPGVTVKPTTTVRNNAGAVVNLPVTYQSRSPSLATVSADGTITAVAEGQAWIVARVTGNGGLSDSVFVNITRGTGPVLRTDATRLVYSRGSTFSILVQLDTRGLTIGAAQVVFTWPSVSDTPGMLQLLNITSGTAGTTAITNDNGIGTTRIAVVNANGMKGLITLARLDFSAPNVGSSQFTTRFVELLGVDQVSFIDSATALLYPVIVK